MAVAPIRGSRPTNRALDEDTVLTKTTSAVRNYLRCASVLLLAIAACGGPDTYDPAFEDTEEDAAYADTDKRWPNPSSIIVCWNDNAYGTATKNQRRAWTQAAIEREFKTRPEFYLGFRGWGRCSATADPDVRIGIQSISKAAADAKIGTDNIGANPSVRINPPSCGRPDGSYGKTCFESLMIHEFLHVAGFKHEQDRPDTPADRRDQQTGGRGDELIGAWDLHSMSNYENPDAFTQAALSDTDVLGLQVMYVAMQSTAVRLYQHRDYRGVSSLLGVGRWSAARDQLSIRDNTLSSFRVPRGRAIKVCDRSNGTGTCLIYKGNVRLMGAGMHDRTSFVEVTPAVQIYRDRNFRGASERINIGTRTSSQLARVGPEAMSSIRVPAGVVAKVCRRDGTSCTEYSRDTANLGGRDNQAGWIQVIPVATGYQHAYFRGGSRIFRPGYYYRGAALGAVGNNTLSSLRVTPGIRATVCLISNPTSNDRRTGTGMCRHLNGDFGGTPHLNSWNDRVRYVRIDRE